MREDGLERMTITVMVSDVGQVSHIQNNNKINTHARLTTACIPGHASTGMVNHAGSQIQQEVMQMCTVGQSGTVRLQSDHH